MEGMHLSPPGSSLPTWVLGGPSRQRGEIPPGAFIKAGQGECLGGKGQSQIRVTKGNSRSRWEWAVEGDRKDL